MGFTFNRAGLRVPVIAVSAYTEPGMVIGTPFEHTSLIRTLSAQWDLGTLTDRDRAAPDLGAVFNRSTPRPRESWPVITPRPYDKRSATNVGLRLNALQRGITGLGAAIFEGTAEAEREVTTVGDGIAFMRQAAAHLRNQV